MRAARDYAISSWVWFGDYSTEEFSAFKKASNFGYDAIELPTFTGIVDLEKTKDALASNCSSGGTLLRPIVIGAGLAGTDISSESSSVVRNAIEYVKRCVKLCSDLGGSLVCGPLYTAVGKLNYITEEDRKNTFVRMAQAFKEIGDFSKDNGVRVALEPLCRYDTNLVNTSAHGIELVDLINHENIGLLLDTFHMNIEEKSISQAIMNAGQRIFHFHACENDRGTPGTGHIPWESVAKSLQSVKYDGMMSLESFTPFEGEFSASMRVWRALEKNQDELAIQGLRFLKSTFP